MSRSAEQLLPKIFGLYTTQIDHRKRHMDRFRLLGLPNRQNTVSEQKMRSDPIDFPSSSGKPMAAGESLAGCLR